MNARIAIVAAALLAGCAATGATGLGKVSEAERARAGVAAGDAPSLAPQAFAEADQALRAAQEAERAGDATGAALHAERAIAAYQRAVALGRLARATSDEAKAKEELARADEQAARLGAARRAAEREADDLDKQLKVAREAERPAASGPADPEREKARLVAAEALATQARLLCGAARLLSADAPGLAEAEAATADLEKKLAAAPKPAPIDAAGRARSACLGALTKARRAAGGGPSAGLPAPDGDQADALLGELSRARFAVGDAKREPDAPSAAPKTPAFDLTPTRDERGVVVTLRALFTGKGDALSPEARATLLDLGKVAQAHPKFAVQVVVHDATRADPALARRRGDAVARALGEGGAPAAKTKVELAGTKAPLFDPSDAARRARNERVEVVFVGG